jgi:DNA-directed RNA polymerase subunit K
MTEKIQYTKFEKARIVGARALQISANAPIILKLSKEELESINYDPITIAEIEFEEEVLPITIHKPLPKKIERKTDKIEIVEQEIEEKLKDEKKQSSGESQEEKAVEPEEAKKESLSDTDEAAKEFEAEMPEEDAGENF